MSSTQITATEIAGLAARAGVDYATGHNFAIIARDLAEWADSIAAGECDSDNIAAVDALEHVAQFTTYEAIGAALQARCDAGEFDDWAPIWAAA